MVLTGVAVSVLVILALLLLVAMIPVPTLPPPSLGLSGVELPRYLREAPVVLAEALTETPSAHIPGLGDVVWGQHATDKHGKDAILARSAVVAGGPGSWWQCRDVNGNTKLYGIAQVLEREGDTVSEHWALVILVRMADGRWAEKSAFITDAAGVRRVIDRDGCSDMSRFAHP